MKFNPKKFANGLVGCGAALMVSSFLIPNVLLIPSSLTALIFIFIGLSITIAVES